MNIQTKASFKKEYLAYFRTKRFMIIALVMVGLAIFSPLLLTGMAALMDMMSDLYDELGMDVSEMTQILGSNASMGVSSTVSDLAGAGLIVVIILINRAAGGEQKKRAVIIPKSAGLRSFPYLFPKYIIYPLSIFFLSVIGMFASWGASALVFDINDVVFSSVLLAGILTGTHMMFYVCFHLTLGTATGKAGMSAAVCIAASILLSNVFAIMLPEYMFNPFALNFLAQNIVHNTAVTGAEVTDILITIAFALGIMIVTYLIALFAQNARTIDNSGNELEL